MLNAWAEIGRDQFTYPALADRVRLPLGALALWDDLCAELSAFTPAPLAPVWGTLALDSGRGGAHERDSIDAMVAALSEMAGPPALLPADGRRAKAVVIPDGWIAPAAVLDGWELALAASGARFVDASATRLENTGPWTVHLDTGEALTAGVVVLANGPFAQALIDPIAELRAATPRLLFEPGAGFDVVSSLEAPGPVVRTMGRGSVGGFHLIAMGEGRFYLGSTSSVALEADWSEPTEKLAALKAMLADEVDADFAQAHYHQRALGFRAFAADGFPLLGQSHMSGLWLAVGLRRDGFTSSPLVGEQIAAAILGQPSTLPARFAPSRTLIAYKTPADAFEDALATHGQARREEFALTAARRGLDAFGLHPALWPFYGDDAAFAQLDHKRET